MRSKPKRLILAGTAFVLVLVVVVLAWRRDDGLPVSAASLRNDTPSAPSPRSSRYVGAYTVPLTADSDPSAARSDRVGEILASNTSSSAKAQALLTLFPQLPVAAQPTTAQHIVNLLPDTAYGTFATHLTNANASAEVRAIIYADLLQRPNNIKLPWLLAVARTPGVSQATDAAVLLQATLREDHGANWNVWSERVRLWLLAHPDDSGGNVSK
jgi:hypothetical protein